MPAGRDVDPGRPGPPRLLVGTAIALPILLVAAIAVAAAVIRGQGSGPLPLAAIPAPEAGSAACGRLAAELPDELDAGDAGELGRRELAAPAPPGTAAWGDTPVVLRCGLGRPAELTATSRLLDVSGVLFLELTGPGMSSWVAVDRGTYVALTVPDGLGSGPLQQVAGTIAGTLPVQDVDVTPPS